MFRHLKPSALLIALAAIPSSCAEARPPIDRVQPNALSKTFFVGDIADDTDDPEFFWRNHVVDATASEELIGIGSSSGLDRVRWHITEKMLFARKAYSENGGDPRGAEEQNTGTIVAAYPIESHFDIQRDYNPSTGEELNVVDENTSDRPWYHREFFRVDWSINQVNTPNWGTLFYGQLFGEVEVRPVTYYESDPNSEDAPHFEVADGYFDITSHFLLAPATTDYFGFQLPTCVLAGFFSGTAIQSCDEQEAVVRSSYWRVDRADPGEDFEPFENTESPRDIFGNPGGIGTAASVDIITPARETYDPGYGYTDSGVTRYMNRHNIWAQNHQSPTVDCLYEARVDADGNGTDDRCENSDTDYDGSEGSQCSARNKCTLPYRDRTVKPIAFFVNPEMPEELQDTLNDDGEVVERGPSEDILYSWNQALKLAVANAREVECRRTGGSRAECHAQFFDVTGNGRDVTQMISYGGWGTQTPSDDTDVLIACHNPVRSYDAGACGPEGTVSRVGDLRKHFIVYWPYATMAPYSGIGNWRGDPLTGQILGAAATTVEAGPARGAAQVRDVIMVANGELTIDDITNGTPAIRYEGKLRDGRTPTALGTEELAARLAEVDFDHLRSSSGLGAPTLPATPAPDRLHSYFETKRDSQLGIGPSSASLLAYDAAAKNLRGSAFEAQLIDPGWLVDARGLAPNTQLTDAVMEQVSPLRGMDTARETQLFQSLHQRLGEHGVCFMDHLASVGNPDVQGVARYFLDKYRSLSETERAARIYEELWKESYKGIQLHELGHALGLLHNFTSSFDAVNYDPQYWQLRTHDGESTASCEGAPRTGDLRSVDADGCMGPRYLDPETRDELGRDTESRPGINYFGHTSAMEYQNSRFFETVGLGQYDVMAMGALYGKVLETYDAEADDGIAADEQGRFLWLLWSQLIEDTLVYFENEVGDDVQPMHYTELARRLHLFDPGRCRDATDAEKAKATWRIVHGKVCAPPPKNHAHWDDFVSSGAYGRYGFSGKKAVVGENADAAGSVRWPYRFGGDLVNSYPHVNPWDSGADIYELTVETVRRNDYGYPFNYFRRERRGWTDNTLPSSTAQLLYERLRSYHWGIAVDNIRLPDTLPAADLEFARESDDWLRPGLMARREMFDGIARSLLSPEIGTYSVAQDGVFDIDRTRDGLFTLDASEARFLAPAYDSGADKGGSWDWRTFLEHGGYRVEKSIAAQALTDGRSVFYFISRDTYLDDRNLYINFRSDAPRAIDRLIGGMLAEDWTTIAPYITSPEIPELNMLNLGGDTVELPTNAQQVFPNIGYNQQVVTLIWAHLFGRVSGDLELSNKLRIWIAGLEGELDVPEEIQSRFSDPETGITYIGRHYGPETLVGREVDQGIASRMLERANLLLSRAYAVETEDVDGEEVPVLDSFGQPTLLLDADGNPTRLEDSDADLETLRKYVGLLDASAQIAALVGHGPFNFF